MLSEGGPEEAGGRAALQGAGSCHKGVRRLLPHLRLCVKNGSASFPEPEGPVPAGHPATVLICPRQRSGEWSPSPASLHPANKRPATGLRGVRRPPSRAGLDAVTPPPPRATQASTTAAHTRGRPRGGHHRPSRARSQGGNQPHANFRPDTGRSHARWEVGGSRDPRSMLGAALHAGMGS